MDEHNTKNTQCCLQLFGETAGDMDKLCELITAGLLRKGEISHPWELLLFTLNSHSLEMLQLVLTLFGPEQPPGHSPSMTPALLACDLQCPVEMVICLMEHFTQTGNVLPLEFACSQNDVELAKALIAYETNRNPSCSAQFINSLYIVATHTANLELLQLLLDAHYNAGGTFLSQIMSGTTGMEMIVQNASYEVEKKIDCFKMLFNRLHPGAASTDPVRYNVNDIARLAVFSSESTSLIPYFIETELMWERRPSIRSLYKRLLPEYEMLALFVLCECGPATNEREELNSMLNRMFYSAATPLFAELKKLYAKAIKPSGLEETSSTEALQLLEDLATLTGTSVLEYFDFVIREGTTEVFRETTINRTQLYEPSYHRANDALITMIGGSSEAVLELLIDRDDAQPLVLFSLLKYCPYLMMHPVYCETCFISETKLFQWFVHLFGPWDAIRQHVGKPVLETFTLKRFARDAIRKAVWQGVNKEEAAEYLFLNRIESFDLPKELMHYLRYCDRGSINYFLEHLDAATRSNGTDGLAGISVMA